MKESEQDQLAKNILPLEEQEDHVMVKTFEVKAGDSLHLQVFGKHVNKIGVNPPQGRGTLIDPSFVVGVALEHVTGIPVKEGVVFALNKIKPLYKLIATAGSKGLSATASDSREG